VGHVLQLAEGSEDADHMEQDPRDSLVAHSQLVCMLPLEAVVSVVGCRTVMVEVVRLLGPCRQRSVVAEETERWLPAEPAADRRLQSGLALAVHMLWQLQAGQSVERIPESAVAGRKMVLRAVSVADHTADHTPLSVGRLADQ